MFTISYHGGTGNDVVLNELVPAELYVDDSWAGTSVGTTPASSYPEGLIFGYDAFATVQAALTQVAVAGTVTVYGGAYSGTVNIATALTEIVAATNPYLSAESTVQVDGEVTLGASTAFRETGATNLVFANAIHGTTAGSQALTITGDNMLTFQGPVGTVDVPLASLTTSAGLGLALDGGGVQTTGPQAYGGAVSLGANVSLATSTGDITFGSTVDSTANLAYSLSLNAGTGDILFTGAVGSGTDRELDQLTIASAADVMFSADVRTTGNLTQTAGTGTTSLHGGTVGDSLSLTTQRVALDSGSLTVANRTTFQTSNANSTAVSQAAGSVLLTKDLLLLGDGTFTLDQPLNHVTGNLAANVSGSLTYQDAGSLQIGTVQATSGLTTGNATLDGGAVTLHAGGLLTVNAVVSSTTGDLVLTGGTGVEHNASGDLTTTGSGTISVTATANDVAMADGTVYGTGSGTVTVLAAANVWLGAISTSGTVTVTGTTGNITDATANEIGDASASINITGGTVIMLAGTGIGATGAANDIDTSATVLRTNWGLRARM